MKDMGMKEGQQFSMEAAAQTLTEIEEHLDKTARGEYIAFCVGCLRKDARLIRDKGGDCSYKFKCPPNKRVWDTLYEWSWKLQKNLKKLGKNEFTEKMRDEARVLRKIIDGEMDPGELDRIDLKDGYKPKTGYIKEEGYIR